MKLSLTRKVLPIVLTLVLVGGIYGTAAALRASSAPTPKPSTIRPASVGQPQAISRQSPAGGGGCSGTTCAGFGGGGARNHIANTGGGSGQYSGYSAVRFDAFSPDPTLRLCNSRTTRDVNALESLGFPADYQGDRYVHYRVGVDRNNVDRVIVGAPGAEYFNEVDPFVEINLNTLATRPTNDPEHAPSGGWVGGRHLTPEVCLPLNGSGQFASILANSKPELRFVGSNGNRIEDPSRFALGMKNLKIDVALSQDELTQASTAGTIDIRFQLINVTLLICDMDPAIEAIRATYPEGHLGKLTGCLLSTDPNSPIIVNTNNITYNVDGSNVAHAQLGVKLRKTGSYRVALLGVYDADIDVSGTVYNATGLTSASDAVDFGIISINGVNRSSGR